MSEAPPEINGKGLVVMSLERPRYRRKLFGYLLLVLAIIIVGAILVLVQRAHDKKKSTAIVATNTCSTKAAGNLLQQAQIPIFGTEQPQLLQIVKKIKTLPGYQYDPNCLYVLTTFYVNTGLAKEAEQYMNDFNQVYNRKDYISSKLGPNAPAPATLRARVAALQKTQQQNKASQSKQ